MQYFGGIHVLTLSNSIDMTAVLQEIISEAILASVIRFK